MNRMNGWKRFETEGGMGGFGFGFGFGWIQGRIEGVPQGRSKYGEVGWLLHPAFSKTRFSNRLCGFIAYARQSFKW